MDVAQRWSRTWPERGQQHNVLRETGVFDGRACDLPSEGQLPGLVGPLRRELADAIVTAPARPEAHFCASTGDGIMIVDVWSSRAEVQRAIIDNQDFQRKWKDAGWPDETVEMFEVHSTGWPK
jgi:hypothetical protein